MSQENTQSYSELQRRLTVIHERNRSNRERYETIMKECEEKFGVKSVAELNDLVEKLDKERSEKLEERDRLAAQAENELSAVEHKLGIVR